MTIRAIFFGTPDFAVPTLKALTAAPEIELISVVTRPDKPAGRGKKMQAQPIKLLAGEMGLEVYQPASLKSEQALAWLQEKKPDVLVVVAYGGFVPTPIRETPPLGCINLHPSLLPKYRGAAPMQWAVINGETITGNTTMHLSDGWDDGDIIYQENEPIHPEDSFGILSERLSQKGGHLIVRSLLDIAAGTAPRRPQNDAEATMAPLIKNEDAQIDWNRSAVEIHNLVRGLNPIPGAFTFFEGKRWKILRTAVLAESPGSPGTIVGTEFNTIRISAADQVLEILELQPEGKKPMAASSFLRGFAIHPGAACTSP
ncbi:MAG: methionyl-tRNA formyltransferase [Candidatus Omnitrophica bacterium]|nr:methionyl-tRNA formyltransferase [Candidatus Omnitrophota bacterium]